MDNVVKRLAEVISNSDLSYSELEGKTGIAKSSIQRYATGKTKKIPIDAVKRIAEATHSSAAWIMGWTTDENMEKKNDAIADIILRLRSDEDFLSLVETLSALPPEQLSAVQAFLDAFNSRM